MPMTAKKVTLEDAWEIVKELGEAQKETNRQLKGLGTSQEETDRQLKETDRQLKESSFELKEVQKETDRQLKETDRQLKESSFELKEAQKETDRQLKGLGTSQKETDRQLKETARQLKETDRRFNSQWGKLVESLVEGNIVEKFSERGIPVQGTTQRAKKTLDGKQYEFDVIVHNGDEIIVVEVKTTLDVEKVKHFIEKLKFFKKFSQSMLTRKFMGPWPLLLPILNQINTQKTKSFLFSRPLEIVRLLLMPKVSNQEIFRDIDLNRLFLSPPKSIQDRPFDF